MDSSIGFAGSSASLSRPSWSSFGRFEAYKHKHLKRPVKTKDGKRRYIVRDYYVRSKGLN